MEIKTITEIAELLKEHLKKDELEVQSGTVGEQWITLKPDYLLQICKTLRDHSSLRFDVLMCLSGVHYPAENELGVTYHLHSTKLNHKVTLKVRVPEETALIPSVESIWKTADWHEREAYDMVGVTFENHPDMRRILCPDEWEGFPLRKDYVQQDTYQGITTRHD